MHDKYKINTIAHMPLPDNSNGIKSIFTGSRYTGSINSQLNNFTNHIMCLSHIPQYINIHIWIPTFLLQMVHCGIEESGFFVLNGVLWDRYIIGFTRFTFNIFDTKSDLNLFFFSFDYHKGTLVNMHHSMLMRIIVLVLLCENCCQEL